MTVELKIETETAKQGITRYEYFSGKNAEQDAAKRRTFLKAIEPFGSSNTYRLMQVSDMLPVNLRYSVRSF